MHSVDPTPDPTSDESSYAAGEATTPLVVDVVPQVGVDWIYRRDDGSVELIEAKVSAWSRLRSAGAEFDDALADADDSPLSAQPCRPKDSSAPPADILYAQNVTVAASGAWIAASVLEGCEPATLLGAADRVLALLDRHPYVQSAEHVRLDVAWPSITRRLLPTGSYSSVTKVRPVPAGGGVVHASSSGFTFFAVNLILLLGHWRGVADGDTPGLRPRLWQRAGRENRVQQEARCAVAAAQCVSQAALEARTAMVTEPWDRGKESVARFARDWLGFRPTKDMVDATSMALLHADLDGFDPDDGEQFVVHLRNEVEHQHRLCRPIGETQLCGRLVDSLDRLLAPSGHQESALAVGDALAVQDPTEAFIAHSREWWYDDRIRRVLDLLTPDERQVTLAYAGGGLSWAEAALGCDLPKEFGEHVRRKVRNRGALLQGRILAKNKRHDAA